MAEDNKSDKTKKTIKTHWVELSGLFLIVFGIFLMLTFLFPAFTCPFGNLFRTSTKKYFGYIEYLLPFFFWIFGSKLIFPKHFSKFSHCFWSLFLIFVDLMLFFSLFGHNGGLVGDTLVNLFRPYIGIAVTLTLAIFIAVAGFLYFFRISIKDFVINFYQLCVVTFKYIVKMALFSFKMLEKAFDEIVKLFNYLTKDSKAQESLIPQEAFTQVIETKDKGKEKIIEKEKIGRASCRERV